MKAGWLSKDNQRGFLDIGLLSPFIFLGFIFLGFLVLWIIPEENPVAKGFLLLEAILLYFLVIWGFISWIFLLISQIRTKRYGWFALCLIFSILSLFYYFGYSEYSGYRAYLKGKIKLDEVMR